MTKSKAVAILLAMVMAAGLMASPAYANGAGLYADLVAPGILNYGGGAYDCGSYTQYVRVYEYDTNNLLAERWHGDYEYCHTMYYHDSSFDLTPPIPTHLVVETWSLYLYPGLDKAANSHKPGSLFWMLVNNWVAPSPSIAHAIEVSDSPDLPLPQNAHFEYSAHVYSPNILTSTRAAVFENPDDNIIITVTNNGDNDLYFSAIGVEDPLEAPFAIETTNCYDIDLGVDDTCEIIISFDAASVAAGSTGMGGLYAKTGIGTSILLIGFVLSAGGIRRRRLVAAVIILALILGMGMLQACGDDNKYYVDLIKKAHYVDTFEVSSNDPDEPSITIGVGAYKNY